MNLPSTWTSSPSRPANVMIPPMPDVARQRLDAMNRGLTEMAPGRYMISPSAAPSAEERRWLEGRREIVLDALQPGDRTAIEDKLHGFAFGFSQLRNLDQHTFKGALANFVDAVDHLPFEAVARACRAWNKARFKWANTAFPPQAPELARAATEMFCEMRMEERELRILLSAEVGHAKAAKAKVAPPISKPGEDVVTEMLKAALPPKDDGRDPRPAPRSYTPGFLDELAARRSARLAREAAEKVQRGEA